MNDTLTRDEEEVLLGRRVRPLVTPREREAFEGRRCLVTGAGGTIGGELARQIAACGPAALTLVDHSEHQLFQIEREMAERWPDVHLQAVLGDVAHPATMHLACARARPHVVFHAAAYKHVTMAERAPCAAARVNVLGTGITMAAARGVGARFVLISTDKAAQPRSVMGATKHLAELVTIGSATPSFHAAVVRFGNVLASSGSFVAIARECIAKGKPIPVTDPSATRYFMTVAEAASLVMKADRLARGGETFWLDMGNPVRLGDLVSRLITLGTAQGHPAVPVAVIGLRAGEKKEEQLAMVGVQAARTSDSRIWVARQDLAPPDLLATALRALRGYVGRADGGGTLETLSEIVPGYQPSHQAWAATRGEQFLLRTTDAAGARMTA